MTHDKGWREEKYEEKTNKDWMKVGVGYNRWLVIKDDESGEWRGWSIVATKRKTKQKQKGEGSTENFYDGW